LKLGKGDSQLNIQAGSEHSTQPGIQDKQQPGNSPITAGPRRTAARAQHNNQEFSHDEKTKPQSGADVQAQQYIQLLLVQMGSSSVISKPKDTTR
jgi:hypothetical protein